MRFFLEIVLAVLLWSMICSLHCWPCSLSASPGPSASTVLLAQDWPWCPFDSEVLSCFSQLMLSAFSLSICCHAPCFRVVVQYPQNNHHLLLYPTDSTGGQETWELAAHISITCIPPKKIQRDTTHLHSMSVCFFSLIIILYSPQTA